MCSQPLRLSRSIVLNDCFASVRQNIVRIGTGREWEINPFPNPAGECSIPWKNSRHYLRNFIPSRIFASYVVEVNRRSLKALPSGQAPVDWFRTQKQSVATGARDSLAIATARREETNA